MNRNIIIALAAIAGLVVIGLFAASPDDEPMEVTDVLWAPSAGGRLEVAFQVTNPGDTARAPECRIIAEDADGYRVGTDKLLGNGDEVPAGGSETFRGVIDIDAEGVARVIVEDC